MALLMLAVIVAALPRLHLVLGDRGDPSPRQFAITGQIRGQMLGLVISRSSAAGRLPIR